MGVAAVTSPARKRGRQLLTDPEYFALLESQGGGCAVCGTPPKVGINPKNGRAYRRLDIDHDHKRGVTRGLLCHICNRVLHARFSPERLRALADYLERSAA